MGVWGVVWVWGGVWVCGVGCGVGVCASIRSGHLRDLFIPYSVQCKHTQCTVVTCTHSVQW